MWIDGGASLRMVIQVALLHWLKVGQTWFLLHSKDKFLAQSRESTEACYAHFPFLEVNFRAKVLQQSEIRLLLISSEHNNYNNNNNVVMMSFRGVTS